MLAIAGRAHAYGAGVFGYSGAPPAMSCNQCHSGGAAPTVTFEGPTTIAPGDKATYAIDIVTSASTSRAGFDVAASAGALSVVAQTNDSFLNSGEISHTKNWPQGKTIRIMFDLTAPAQEGPLTIFATALNSDGVDDPSGDLAASATYAVNVTAPAANADLSSLPDLAEVDAITQATEHPRPDAGPPHDEARWSCRFGDGAPAGTTALFCAALLALVVRRRARR